MDLSTLPGVNEGLLLRASVSLNGIDFSEPSSDAIIAHACSPRSIRPNCLSFLHKPMDLVLSGTGFPPTAIVETTVTYFLEDTSSSITVKGTSTKASELHFPAPSMQDLDGAFGAQVNNFDNTNVKVNVLINGMIVNESPFNIMMFHPKPVHASTDVCYYRGGTVLYLGGDGICLYSENSRIQVKNAETGATPTLGLEIFCLEDGGFEGKVIFPPLHVLFPDIDDGQPGSTSGTHFRLQLLLDGVTVPSDEFSLKLLVCYGIRNLACKAPPKTGFAANSTVVCTAQGLVGGQSCVVRIIGAKEGAYLQVSATINPDDSTFSFIVPEDIGQLTPEESKGKLKLFSIAVSLDGGSNFDRSDGPILQIK